MRQLFQDQLHRPVLVPRPPQRIISLVPSITELLFALGLQEEVVGITRYCVHPPAALNSKTVIGGTKKFDFETIERLTPDLIIGNKEENYKEGIDLLSQRIPVWMSDVNDLNDALKLITDIGQLTNRHEQGIRLQRSIRDAFLALQKQSPRPVLYLIWRDPWMGVGPDTFIDSMIAEIGWRNVLHEPRYPELTVAEIQRLSPEVVLLPSEPFPFKDRDADYLRQVLPAARIINVDGEMFSWYGSRLEKAPAYFNSLSL